MSLDLSARPGSGADGPPSQMKSRRLLRQDVHDVLLQELVSGKFLPGERIRDDDIAKRLNVSRTPVREALVRLTYAGLVDTAPNRYTRVTELDLTEVADAVGILSMLYPSVIESIMQNISAEDDVELEILERRILAARELNVFAASEAIGNFCSARLSATILAQMVSIVQPRVTRAVRLNPALVAGAVTGENLVGIVRSLRTRDASICTRHIVGILTAVRSGIDAAQARTD